MRKNHLASERAARGSRRRASVLTFLALVFGGGAGCPNLRGPGPVTQNPQPTAVEISESPIFTPPPADGPLPAPVARTPRKMMISVLHVQIPRDRRSDAARVWPLLRENAIDADTLLRLRLNGIRVGLGAARAWEDVTAIIEAIDGRMVRAAAPVAMPAGLPVTLELDDEPRDQMLFYVGRDGVLSGSTWLRSKNVFRVVCASALTEIDRIRFSAIPEVQQDLEGWTWVQAPEGWTQAPRKNQFQFEAAAVTLLLDPGEFILLSVSPDADSERLLGSALLTHRIDGLPYDSYIFMKPELRTAEAELADKME